MKLGLIQMELPTKLLRLLTFKDETNGLLLRVMNCLVRLRTFERAAAAAGEAQRQKEQRWAGKACDIITAFGFCRVSLIGVL